MSIKKKQILCYQVYEYGNCGDELFFSSLDKAIAHLRQINILPKHACVVGCLESAPSITFELRDLRKLGYVKKMNVNVRKLGMELDKKIAKDKKAYETHTHIGGGLVTGWPNPLHSQDRDALLKEMINEAKWQWM